LELPADELANLRVIEGVNAENVLMVTSAQVSGLEFLLLAHLMAIRGFKVLGGGRRSGADHRSCGGSWEGTLFGGAAAL